MRKTQVIVAKRKYLLRFRRKCLSNEEISLYKRSDVLFKKAYCSERLYIFCSFTSLLSDFMKMKNKYLSAAVSLILPLLVFQSCEKEGVKLFDGSYSFKTSGILNLDRKTKATTSSEAAVEQTKFSETADSDFPSIPGLPDLPDIPGIDLPEGDRTFSLSLSAESGQMNIIRTEGNSAVVTMNIVGGDALVFDAQADGKTLKLSPLRRIISFRDAAQTATLDVTVSGTGEKHEDVIVFSLNYTGSGESTLYDYKINSSEIKCVAKENE